VSVIGRLLRFCLNSVRLWDLVRFVKQHSSCRYDDRRELFMRERDCGPLRNGREILGGTFPTPLRGENSS
jgi:hypothetical protein